MRLCGIVLATAAAVSAVSAVSAEVVDQVAAEVNGEHIMLSDVVRELGDRLADLPADLSPAERRRQRDVLIKARLLQMIREKMLLQAAERDLTDQHKAAIDRRAETRLKEVERDAGGREALRRELADKGRTPDDLRDDLRRRITVQSYVASKVRPGGQVTRRRLLNYYRRNPGEFSRRERRSFRIIMIRVDRFATKADARANAAEVKKRLTAGEKFVDLVKVFSHGLRDDEGGLWAPMARGDFAVEAVDKAVFAGKPGEVSDVIEMPKALYLVKVERVEPAIDLSFEDAQAGIRKKLMVEILRKRRFELAIELEKRSHLEVYYR